VQRVGSRNVCKTEFIESKDKRGNITKTRETICRDDPHRKASNQRLGGALQFVQSIRL